jgi:2'-5' RNA ligase
MRVFIAIEFSQHIKNCLQQVQQQITSLSRSGNFTRIENFHLTLKFIGEIQPYRVEDIVNVMGRAAADFKPFKLYMGDLGYFPRGNKKIIWIGIKGELETLHNLVTHINKSLQSLGINEDKRRYFPHVTLGREVSLLTPFSELSNTIPVHKNPIEVCQISLMESRRREGRLVYIPLYTKPLIK